MLRNCEMDSENQLQIHVKREFCFADFLKAFRKPCNAKKKSYRYIVTFIGESGIDTGRVSREFHSGLQDFKCIRKWIQNRKDAGCTR